MTVYEYRTSMTVAAASFTSVTHHVPGGILRQVCISSATDTTVFKANLQDESGTTRKSWDFVQSDLNDDTLTLPIAGSWTVNVTNVSPNDTFSVLLAVQE